MSLVEIRNFRRLGRLRDALALARTLAHEQPSPIHWRALGSLELEAESTGQAAWAFRQALRLQPRDGAAYNDLGTSLARLGQWREAADAFEKAAACGHDRARVYANLAAVYLRLGHHDRAARFFLSSLSDRSDPGTAIGLARAWTGLGRSKAALELMGRLLEADAAPFACVDALLELELGTAEERLAWAELVSRNHPRHAGLQALWMRALRSVDASRAQARFASQCRLVHQFDLSARDGATIATLARSTRTHRSMQVAPANHATVGGRHSGDLFSEPTSDLAVLQDLIFDSAQRYLTWLRTDASLRGHSAGVAFLRSRPPQLKIHAWAVLLEGDNYQESHFHPDAWVSGCLYLEVPPCVNAHRADGHLALGFPGDPPQKTIRPRPGRVVLFPSSVDHRTLPHRGQGQRLSVAFDLVGE